MIAPLLINPSSGVPLDPVPEWSQQIHILNKTTSSAFETIQKIDVDHQPGSIVINGDTMVVGLNWETLQTGAAYVYVRNFTSGLWSETQRIVADDNRIDAEFGTSNLNV